MWQRRDWEAAAIPWRQSVIAVVRVQPQRPKVKSSAAGTTSKCLCSMAKKKSIWLPDGGSECVGVSEPPISDSLKIPPKNLQNKRKTLRARQSFLSFLSIFNAETILGWGPCENVWVVKGKMKEEDFLYYFFFTVT